MSYRSYRNYSHLSPTHRGYMYDPNYHTRYVAPKSKGYGYSYHQQYSSSQYDGALTPRGYVTGTMSPRAYVSSSLGDYTTGQAGATTTTVVRSSTTTGGFTSTDRVNEKHELQRLHDRIAAYILKIRQMDKGLVDSGAFLQSVKILEEELVNLKAMYENELRNVRQQLDVITTERNNYQAEYSKIQQSTGDFQGRLTMEVDKNRKLVEDMNVLQKRISALEVELNQSRISANQPLQDVHRLQKEVENYMRENEMLKARLQKEQLLVKEADDRLRQMSDKMQFSDQVSVKQAQELKGRLEQSNAAILSLEARLREAGKADTSIPDLLKQVRGAAAEEFRKYQLESEATYGKSISALKSQMESDSKNLEIMTSEKSQLIAVNGELKARITALEGQIQGLIQEKSALEGIISQDRNAFAEQIKVLERKLQSIQELLFVKLKEASVSQEASVSLKAEIQSMKVLLDEEERRLLSKLSLGTTGSSQVVSYSVSSPRQAISYSVTSPRVSQSTTYAKTTQGGVGQAMSWVKGSGYGYGQSGYRMATGSGGQKVFTRTYKLPYVGPSYTWRRSGVW